MKRDHTKLICDIGELSDLFIDSVGLDNFLQNIVFMISEHMNSEVCSIYLYYEWTDELVLKATKGLNPESIGNVKMRLGEGLSGLALKEIRPICEGNARNNPNFKYFPGIGEEQFESFLAVPIVRGRTRIGVMVVQNSKRNCFEEEDIKVLRAITSQLANTIETTKLLMSFNETAAKQRIVLKPRELKLVQGRVGASGFAFAEAVIVKTDSLSALSLQQLQTQYSLSDFQQAIQATEKQLELFQKEIEDRLFDVASLIFTAQILMLKDKVFVDAIVDLIQSGVNPPQAILEVVHKYVLMFQLIPNAYLKEKSQDVKDIGNRLLQNLIGHGEKGNDYEGRIVIAEELFPSDALKLSSQKVAGIILLSGGTSSHLSILSRSLNIPMVITDTPQLLDLPPATKILLDAEQGNIYINPTPDVSDTFRQREDTRKNLSSIKDSVMPTTHTQDGARAYVLANINLLGDVKAARELKAEGIGLYRTEFPFIVRSDFPTEEEQFVIYKKLVDSMSGHEITFRTLDIGGDKVLSYYYHGKEENPFLGMRSIRFSLKHKDIFSQQLRAILRAGHQADLKIMFPMISSLDEFLEAKEIVRESMFSLSKDKIPYHASAQIGLMIELPSVLEIIEDLAQAADFFSIGTNDFIQYMLAVDRTNEKVADLYLPYHPSILRGLKRIVDAAITFKKEVSICGDMAHDEKYIAFLLGIGVRRFSVDVHHIPKVQRLIVGTDVRLAKKNVEFLLTKPKIKEIADIIGPRDQR